MDPVSSSIVSCHQTNNYRYPAPPQQQLRSSSWSSSSSLSAEFSKVPISPLAYHKRADLIERLIDTSAEIIDSIWSPSLLSIITTEHNVLPPTLDDNPSHQRQLKVVDTKAFIEEILRRSKTTYSNLQTLEDSIICCGRRVFLASLMVAAKFLQDKNYRNRAWSRISGLALSEINAAELVFLKLINYNLYISKPTFDQWYSLLQTYLYRQRPLKQQSSGCWFQICGDDQQQQQPHQRHYYHHHHFHHYHFHHIHYHHYDHLLNHTFDPSTRQLMTPRRVRQRLQPPSQSPSSFVPCLSFYGNEQVSYLEGHLSTPPSSSPQTSSCIKCLRQTTASPQIVDANPHYTCYHRNISTDLSYPSPPYDSPSPLPASGNKMDKNYSSSGRCGNKRYLEDDQDHLSFKRVK